MIAASGLWGGKQEGRKNPFSSLPTLVPVHRVEGELKSLYEMTRRLKGEESCYYTGTIFRTPFSYRTS